MLLIFYSSDILPFCTLKQVSAQMPVLTPKPISQLSEADFVAHAVWAAYSDPEEMELLESLGFSASQVMSAFAECTSEEDLVFPLPNEAASLPFRYLWLSATVTLPTGVVLTGYRTSPCLAVFCTGHAYLFNKALRSASLDNAISLAQAAGVNQVFPLKVQFLATGSHEEFRLE